MPLLTRRLGRTDHHSSVAILGGAAFWRATPDEAAQSFALALDRGVNHLDIAPSYGAAEDAVGPLVPAVSSLALNDVVEPNLKPRSNSMP